VILLATLFLKERINFRFIKWAALALAAGIILSFPDLDFTFLRGDFDPRSRGVALALGAAAIWAASTVAGKSLLHGISPAQVTGWRYLFGLLALMLYMAIAGPALPWDALIGDRIALRSVLIMATIPGLLGMFLYYQGLSRTRATVATLAELIFPVTSILLNAVWLERPLSPVQLGAALVLLASVTRISLLEGRTSP
jgi:drug/metabolite transporter (DMT)-like permease